MNNVAKVIPPATREDHLREAISRCLGERNRDLVVQHARMLLDEFSSARTFRFLSKITKDPAAPDAGFRPFRIALLSSFSIEFIHDALLAHGLASGLIIEIWQSGFGAFRQAILDKNSPLYQYEPDLTILAVEGESWLPEAYGRYNPASVDVAGLRKTFAQEINGLLAQFRSRSKAPLLVHDLDEPSHPTLGIVDGEYPHGQSALVGQLNAALSEACSQFADVHVLRYARLVGRIGMNRWYDRRMQLYARQPLSQAAIAGLAREYVKYCRALTGQSRKCLVLDLDNTLWGGVIGEEGMDGIQLGPNYPGNAFVEFQQAILGLRARGVLLAIASKNNPHDVDEVLEKHASMVLRRRDFSAIEVHWEPKSESLRRIAHQLNIGLEHMVFVDDNPSECEHVRVTLPMVTVVQLPQQPERYHDALFEDGWFDVLTLSGEDLQRSALYEQRAEAEKLRGSAVDLEDFYRELDMVLTISSVDEKNLARAAQLTQKTNQFNATTRRYSPGEIEKRMADPDWKLFVVSVRDRFGDNGIVGLAMACRTNSMLNMDTFLLSCRVIGRTVETAMLAYLRGYALSSGAQVLQGEIIATPKNAPARDLYERHGFVMTHAEHDLTRWELDIAKSVIDYPNWFKVIINDEIFS